MYGSTPNQDEQSLNNKERAVKIGALGFVLVGALVVMAVVLGQKSLGTQQLESQNKILASGLGADNSVVKIYNPQRREVGKVDGAYVVDKDNALIGVYSPSSGKFYSAKNNAYVGKAQKKMGTTFATVKNAQGIEIGRVYTSGKITQQGTGTTAVGYAQGPGYMEAGGAGLVFGLVGWSANVKTAASSFSSVVGQSVAASKADVAMQVAGDNWSSENSCRNYCYDTFYHKFYNYPNYLQCEQMCFGGKYALWAPHSSSCTTTCHASSGNGNCHAICYPPV